MDPSRVDPSRVDPSRVDPSRVNPSRVETSRVDPSRMGSSLTPLAFLNGRVQLLGAIRRVLHGQYKAGNLPQHIARKLEEDVRELGLVVGGLERLFSSPVPPTSQSLPKRTWAVAACGSCACCVTSIPSCCLGCVYLSVSLQYAQSPCTIPISPHYVTLTVSHHHPSPLTKR